MAKETLLTTQKNCNSRNPCNNRHLSTISMSKTTTISRNDSVRARSNSSPSAFLLSAKSFVLSKQNHSDDTLFPNFPDDEEEDGNENRWFDCLHLDCLGNRPHLAGRTSTTTAVIDFLVVIMIATLGVYFLLNDFLIGLFRLDEWIIDGETWHFTVVLL